MASPLYVQSREDCESSRTPTASEKRAAMIQYRGASAKRTQVDLRERFLSSSSQEPRASGKLAAMFSYDAKPHVVLLLGCWLSCWLLLLGCCWLVGCCWVVVGLLLLVVACCYLLACLHILGDPSKRPNLHRERVPDIPANSSAFELVRIFSPATFGCLGRGQLEDRQG